MRCPWVNDVCSTLNVITGEVESNQLVVVHVINHSSRTRNSMHFRRSSEMVQYLSPFWCWKALKVMQLLEEAPFGFEEVDALLTSVKNSASEGLVQISSRRIRRLLTLIAGSPLFFCRKVGMCTGHFCDMPMLYCTPGSCVTSSVCISKGELGRGCFSLSRIMLIRRSRRSILDICCGIDRPLVQSDRVLDVRCSSSLWYPPRQ